MPGPRPSPLPLLIVLGVLGCPLPAGSTCAPASQFAKAHTWDDVDGDGMTSAGDLLHYTLLFCEPGSGDQRCAFEDTVPAGLLLDAASVLCTPDPGTTPPGTCGESPAGSGIVVVDYAPNLMDRSACLTVTFDVAVVQAPAVSVCNQAVNQVDRSNVSENDCQALVPLPDLEIVKTARSPTVQPGDQAVFDIIVRNIGAGRLDAGSVLDLLDPCFLPFGVDGQDCDPTAVSCAGPGCGSVTCTYASGGLAFDLGGFSLEPHDVLRGGPDEVAITVRAAAGPSEGPCTNSAVTSDPDSPSLIAGATVDILATADLDITNTANAPAVPPGAPVSFDIVIHDRGAAPFIGGTLTDTLDVCFQALGPDGAPCDPLVVSCIGTGCAGTTCVYSNGGLGFTLTGFALTGDDGTPGGDDQILVHLVATAGPIETGDCLERAATSDPDSPILLADAIVAIAVPPPDLEITKTSLTPLVAPNRPVDFDIVVHNLGQGPLASGSLVDLLEPCFRPLGDPGTACDPLVVSCAGAGCAGSSCVVSAGGQGFTFSGFSLTANDAAPGGPDEITLRVMATAGPATGICANRAETYEPGSPLPLVAHAEVNVDLRPDLEIAKTALTPSVPTGGQVAFSIVVHNIGNAALSGGSMTDTMNPCFLPLGTTGLPCDPARVSCAGPGCAAAACIYANGGLGFDLSGFDLDPDDGAPGGADQITVTVNTTAGPNTGLCANTARTSDPNSPALIAPAGVTIVPAVQCDLMDGDLTFPPRTPDPSALYGKPCPGSPRLSRRNTAGAGAGDLADDLAGTPGTLRLYQLDCGCATDIVLTRNRLTGKVRLDLK